MAYGYEVVKTLTGTYIINWDVVFQIARSFFVSAYVIQRRKEKIIRHNFGWSAETIEIEVPWSEVRDAAQKSAEDQLKKWQKGSSSINLLKQELNSMYNCTVQNQNLFKQICRSAHSSSMNSLNSSIEKIENTIKYAEFTRDASHSLTLVGATFLSGGTAVAFAGAGSALSGVAKYQDTQNLGAAVLTTTASFITTILPIGVAKSGIKSAALDGYVVIVESAFDLTGNMMEGDSISLALQKTTGNLAVKSAFKHKAVKDLISKSFIPISTKLITNKSITQFIAEGTSAGIQGQINSRFNTMLDQQNKNRHSTKNPAIVSTDKYLVHQAIMPWH